MKHHDLNQYGGYTFRTEGKPDLERFLREFVKLCGQQCGVEARAVSIQKIPGLKGPKFVEVKCNKNPSPLKNGEGQKRRI